MAEKQTHRFGWSAKMPRDISYEVKFWMVVLLATIGTFIPYFRLFEWDYRYASLTTFVQQLPAGHVTRPFVYRVLLPFLAELAGMIYPLHPMYWQMAFMYVCLFGFVVAFRTLAQTFWDASRKLDYIVILSIPLIAPWSIDARYLYDLPVLCFFTWGIVCIARKHWRALLIFYTVGCFNKETTVFLTFIFAACYAHEYRSQWYQRLIGMQLGIYAFTRIALIYIFRDFPGMVVEYHFMDHFKVYAHYHLRTTVAIIGIMVMTALIVHSLRRKPVFLLKTLLAVLPFIAVLYLLFGFPYEFRVFYEVYPLFLLLSIPPLLLPPAAHVATLAPRPAPLPGDVPAAQNVMRTEAS